MRQLSSSNSAPGASAMLVEVCAKPTVGVATPSGLVAVRPLVGSSVGSAVDCCAALVSATGVCPVAAPVASVVALPAARSIVADGAKATPVPSVVDTDVAAVDGKTPAAVSAEGATTEGVPALRNTDGMS